MQVFINLVSVIAIAIFANKASSQNSSGPSGTGTEAAIPEGNVMTHIIQVGDAAGSKLFYPEKITAKKGDLVQFHFYPKVFSIVKFMDSN